MAYPFPVSLNTLCKEACGLGLTPVQFQEFIGLPKRCNSIITNFEDNTLFSEMTSQLLSFLSSKQGHCTYQDFAILPASSRAQLIDGYIMAEQTVSFNHQAIITEIMYQIVSYLKATHSPFKVISSPIHLSLPAPHPVILLPDIAIIKYPHILTGQTVKDVPVFAAEVLSPTTYCLDTIKKRELYKQNGVREYWIISLESHYIRSYQFPAPDLTLIKDFSFHSKIPVCAIENLFLDFSKLVSLL